MMGWSRRCYILCFVEIGPPVPKKIFEVFFIIYGRGGHLGHVTSIMSSDFHFLVPESFHTKFSSDWPGLYPGILGMGPFFLKLEKILLFGNEIPGVSCKIWEFCMILKKFQLGKGPLFCPCRHSDNPLLAQ